MSKQVWKYILDPINPVVSVPKGTEILHIDSQNNDLCIWALVDIDEPDDCKRSFLVVGTGHSMPSCELKFIGTALLHNGSLVLHVFEEIDDV